MSQTDLSSLEIARAAIERVSDELEIEHLKDIANDFDVFDAIDSFAIVELLMTTEALLEEAMGKYIPLADEKIFDAQHSPLHSLEGWAAYIDEQRGRA